MRILVVSSGGLRLSLLTERAGAAAAVRFLFLLSACFRARHDFDWTEAGGVAADEREADGMDPVLDRVRCLCLAPDPSTHPDPSSMTDATQQ